MPDEDEAFGINETEKLTFNLKINIFFPIFVDAVVVVVEDAYER